MTRELHAATTLLIAAIAIGAAGCGSGEEEDFPPVQEVAPAPVNADSAHTDTLRDTITTRTTM
jgi:hypothetical protein